MRGFEADLHNHTTYSDGVMTPDALITWAKQLDLRVIAVTDHDTIEGCEEALEAGRRNSLEVLPGVEVTVRFKRELFTGSLHYLLYFSEPLLHDQQFTRELMSIVRRGRGDDLFLTRIAAINDYFGPAGKNPLLPRNLTFEEVQTLGSNLTRRHLVTALQRFLNINDRETINQIINNDSPAYIPSGVDLYELKNFFEHYPQVLRVIAHPAAGSFPGESHYKEVLPPFEIVKQILPEFIELGLDGFEIEYPGHTPEHRLELEQIRAALGLPLATGGSDCHDYEKRPLAHAGVGLAVVEKMKTLFTTNSFDYRKTSKSKTAILKEDKGVA